MNRNTLSTMSKVESIICPFCKAKPNQHCKTNTGGIAKNIHKARYLRLSNELYIKEAADRGEYIKYEKIISPTNLEELVKLAANYNKDKTIKAIVNIGNAIASEESTYRGLCGSARTTRIRSSLITAPAILALAVARH